MVRREDEVDRELESAEDQASLSRSSGVAAPVNNGNATTAAGTRPAAASLTSSSNADGANEVETQEMGLGHVPTARDNVVELERHQTALERIHTAKSQHSGTVGATLRSRQSRKPLPPFGAGRSYPQPLPAREDYVVEFEGADDPMHPHNWPLRRK